MKLNKYSQYYLKVLKDITERNKKYPRTSAKLKSITVPVQNYFSKPKSRTISKSLQKYCKYMNSNIESFFSVPFAKQGYNHNLSCNSQTTDHMAVMIYIHNVPCLLYISYFKLNYVVLNYKPYNPDSSVFLENRSSMIFDSNGNIDFSTDNIESYNTIRDNIIPHPYKVYTDEELFQLSTVIPNPEVYIEVLNRFNYIYQYCNIQNMSMIQFINTINTPYKSMRV